MKALKVEFAPRPRVPLWLWFTGCALLLAIATEQGWRGWQAQQRLHSARGQRVQLSAELERAAQARRDAATQAAVEPPYARDLAAVSKVAAFPIDRVFASVESARVPGVRVTSLEVATAETSARVELEYGDLEALMRYLSELNAGEPRARWSLQSAKAGAAGAPGNASVVSSWP